MGTGIKSTLDHPLFRPGHTDNRARTLMADGIGELGLIVNDSILELNLVIEGQTS